VGGEGAIGGGEGTEVVNLQVDLAVVVPEVGAPTVDERNDRFVLRSLHGVVLGSVGPNGVASNFNLESARRLDIREIRRFHRETRQGYRERRQSPYVAGVRRPNQRSGRDATLQGLHRVAMSDASDITLDRDWLIRLRDVGTNPEDILRRAGLPLGMRYQETSRLAVFVVHVVDREPAVLRRRRAVVTERAHGGLAGGIDQTSPAIHGDLSAGLGAAR
jgi:hypothetical protein